MITFWSGHYTKNQLIAIRRVLQVAYDSIKIQADCSEYKSCETCEYKEPCRDLKRLKNHITELAG